MAYIPVAGTVAIDMARHAMSRTTGHVIESGSSLFRPGGERLIKLELDLQL